ncbi:hypothetical protein SAMN05444851_0381 [Aliiroseovarius sediminilitoris]|uniref:FlgN protein n=1 Tax=Aliiroseovarius sediminilitoris TaxID=1173584 RepID=A0A1I0MXD6_9RHOB|nr:hypothetical protein [Aliiroseovarius sediminilitoris]SEV92955.1 hypothetical protein SAMN05444851_0381 [Aliiroseovarius sediminilitoris]
MEDSSAPTAMNALEDLLERERVFILSGEIEKLTRLAPEKERLLNSVKSLEADQPALERLRHRADRNQQLLAATVRGIRAVKQRLDALMKGQSELRTYTREGRAQDLSKRGSSFERKA